MNATLRLNQRNCLVDSGQHLNIQLFKGQKMGIIAVLNHQWKTQRFYNGKENINNIAEKTLSVLK